MPMIFTSSFTITRPPEPPLYCNKADCQNTNPKHKSQIKTGAAYMDLQVLRMLPDQLCQITLGENVKWDRPGLIGSKGVDKEQNGVHQIDPSEYLQVQAANAAGHIKKGCGKYDIDGYAEYSTYVFPNSCTRWTESSKSGD